LHIVIQRVRNARLYCKERVVSEISKGLVVFVGFRNGDNESIASQLIKKIVNLRIFDDAQGKMNLSVLDIMGEILVVPNFTLVADLRKGNRPSFDNSLVPQQAQPLFEQCRKMVEMSGVRTQTGIFGAHMVVEINNDGPVTFTLNSES